VAEQPAQTARTDEYPARQLVGAAGWRPAEPLRDLVAHSLLRPRERTKIVAGRHQTLPMTTSSSLGGRFGLER
jgi:hypothetical protein